MSGIRESCVCTKCQDACLHTPGWFAPGEAETAAAHVGLSLESFFQQHLGVNWYVGGYDEDDSTFALAPATVGMEAGREYPADPRGTCVFFQKDGRCAIHAVRPLICREYLHTDSDVVTEDRQRRVAKMWRGHHAQIVALLRREPESKEFTLLDALVGP